jgi:hypothetical protein
MDTYQRTRQETGYNPSKFLGMFHAKGGVRTPD